MRLLDEAQTLKVPEFCQIVRKSSDRRLKCQFLQGFSHDPMKVQLHFAVHDSADTFDDAIRFMVRFSEAFNVRQRGSRRDTEGALEDNLVSGIQFRDDEMNGGPEAQHVVLERIFIRSKTRKRR